MRRAANEATPVGFGLSDPPIFVDTLANYRMRRDDAQKLHPNEPVCLSGVYFPLLATIIPKWIEDIRKKDQASDTDSDEEVFKIVFLVSGVGIPRDNRQSAEGNSTQGKCYVSALWASCAVLSYHAFLLVGLQNLGHCSEWLSKASVT